ncbi:Macrophage mannose receptor 1-like [Oopsacas minuta]|uniref:Macrophage mannose receptor 1-like n=1 Tax=Oopsacas minuta TaxID=111878 RepID=A0AAV7JX16_9METZ|nr:Macrophage mannose receptor 1-like [Oopsacas minuta]
MKFCILLSLLLILVIQGTSGQSCPPAEGDIRLTNTNFGTLEAYVEGDWGPVCSRDWMQYNGDVICRILGYRWATFVNTSQHDSRNTNYRIAEVNCIGDETNILECGHRKSSEIIRIPCGADDHVGMICQNSDSDSDCDVLTDDGSCVKFYYESDGINWAGAQTICENNGGDLATISSSSENSKINPYLNTDQDECWIGLNSIDDHTNTYTWIDGSPLVYENWATGQPGNTNHDCTIIDYPGATWYDTDCTYEYVCFFCIHKAPNIKIPDIKGCDAITSSGKCFNHIEVDIEINWLNAERICSADDQDLASISSSHENTVMYSLADDQTYRDCWIGFNDRDNENSYVWENGNAVTYTNWGYGQPDSTSEDDDCAHITPDSYWYNEDCCEYKQCFFCSSPVTPFGRTRNVYESLEDNSILTSDSELFCITEQGKQVEWYYLDQNDLYGSREYISTPTTDSVGISKMNIELEGPGYFSCNVHQDNGIPRTYTIALLETGIYLADPFGHDVTTIHLEALRNNHILTKTQTIYCVASTKDIIEFEWIYIDADGIATAIPADTGSSKGVSVLTVSITNPGSYSCEVILDSGPNSTFTVILAPILYTDPILGCDVISDDGNCFTYAYNGDGIDWYDAQSSCEANRGDLASISSSKENSLLLSLFTNDVDRCWIGLDHANQFTWIDDSRVTYINFATGDHRRSVETNERVRSRRSAADCSALLDTGWNTIDCSIQNNCYFCTNKVSQFGKLIEANRYTALYDNAILTASTTLHCITEQLGTPQVIWSYVGLDGTMSTYDVPTNATTGASSLYIDINNPGYYSCEITQFRGERKKYTAALLEPSVTTIISVEDTYTYTHGIDREDISLFCHSFNHSIAFENIGWRQSASVYLPNPLDVTSLPINSYQIECVDTSTDIALFAVDLTIQGRPVVTIYGESYPLLPPKVNTVYVRYQDDLLLAINLQNPLLDWITPAGRSGNSNPLALNLIDENNAGLFSYYVVNWNKKQKLAYLIEILVYPFGIQSGPNYIPLDDNSIVSLNDDLYCWGELDTTASWVRINFAGMIESLRMRRLVITTTINTISLTSYDEGFFECSVTKNGDIINTYTAAAFHETSNEISVISASQFYTFTKDIDTEPRYVFCHQADNSVPFENIFWRELGTNNIYPNPLQISNLQIDGERRIMECLDSRANVTILNIDLILQGPVEVTLDVGDTQTDVIIGNEYSINYRATDVVLSSNLVGRWTNQDDEPVGDGSSIIFPTFELSDGYVYSFLVTDVENTGRLVASLTLKVYRFGQQLSANIYEGIEHNSIITTSTTLYCLDGSSNPFVTWRYVSLDGTISNLEADTELETGISLLTVGIDEPGYYSCEVNEDGGYTYTVAILNTSIYTTEVDGETYTYTIGVDADNIFLFCYNSMVAFSETGMTDPTTSEEVTNPLEINNLPNIGMNRQFECTSITDGQSLHYFDLLIRGPPVIILDE